MRQDELDLVKTLAAPPVLDGGGPAFARVAEAMGEDDGRSVTPVRREDEGRGAADGGHDDVGFWEVVVVLVESFLGSFGCALCGDDWVTAAQKIRIRPKYEDAKQQKPSA